jgi:hypothetical protein
MTRLSSQAAVSAVLIAAGTSSVELSTITLDVVGREP